MENFVKEMLENFAKEVRRSLRLAGDQAPLTAAEENFVRDEYAHAVYSATHTLVERRSSKPRRTFVVQGTGEFPEDMLRYDHCWPATDEDKRIVDARYCRPADQRLFWETDTRLKLNRVTLETNSPHAPTEGRWRSFLWSVVEGRKA